MARQQKLKVYRTPIGFHDAYVAAPSQKAALATWGSDSDLFAQKIAEEVTDPKLMKEPLSKPGEVVRRLRGTSQGQVEALGSGPAKKASRSDRKAAKSKPSRSRLTEAEEKLSALKERHNSERRDLEEQLAALGTKLAAMKRNQAAEMKSAVKLLTDEQNRYDRVLADWKKA